MLERSIIWLLLGFMLGMIYGELNLLNRIDEEREKYGE